MSDRTPHEQRPAAGMRREPQVLEPDELTVYEALATFRRPLGAGELSAKTGLPESTVRAALDRLTELEMAEAGKDGTTVGENTWDVRGRN